MKRKSKLGGFDPKVSGKKGLVSICSNENELMDMGEKINKHKVDRVHSSFGIGEMT